MINLLVTEIRKRSESFGGQASANMYKTVRHGENSLQYTILPQTEEVLSNSGLKGKGRDYSPSIHVRRSRRKHKCQLTLVVVISLIIAFALLCVSIYSLNPVYFERWLGKSDRGSITIASVVPTVLREAKSRKKELKVLPEIISTLESRFEASPTTTTTNYATTTKSGSTLPSTTTGEKSTTPPWIMPALKSWKSSSTIQTIPTEGNEIPIIAKPNSKQNVKEKTDVDNMSIKPWEKDIIIRPTVTPESITLRNVIKYYSRSFVPSERPGVTTTKMFDDVLITTKGTTPRASIESTTEQSKLKDLKDAMLSVDDDDEFKESLEVDEVFSLPPLKPEAGVVSGDSDEVTVSKADGGWYGARWPFVDTSSYFQWTVSTNTVATTCIYVMLTAIFTRSKRTCVIAIIYV